MGGRLYLVRRAADKALSALASACQHYEAGHHNLRVAETLLPLSEAAAAAGNADVLGRAAARFDELAPLVPGMALPHAASRVRLLCALEEGLSRRLIHPGSWSRSASARGGRGSPWVPGLADRLERGLTAAEG